MASETPSQTLTLQALLEPLTVHSSFWLPPEAAPRPLEVVCVLTNIAPEPQRDLAALKVPTVEDVRAQSPLK